MNMHALYKLEAPAAQNRRSLHRRRRRRSVVLSILPAGIVAVALIALTSAALHTAPASDGFWATLSAETLLSDSDNDHALLHVPFFSQIDEFPTGCESVSAAMLLNYYDFDVAPGAFIDDFLPLGNAPEEDLYGNWYGCDPWEAFPGDPRSDFGWGCYSPVIERALNNCLSGTGYRAERLSDVPLETLCTDYIDCGNPVLVWATINMDTPRESITWVVPETGREITWVSPMHCLVLTGYDPESYIFNDPLAGEAIRYDKADVECAYAALYEQAVVITYNGN